MWILEGDRSFGKAELASYRKALGTFGLPWLWFWLALCAGPKFVPARRYQRIADVSHHKWLISLSCALVGIIVR